MPINILIDTREQLPYDFIACKDPQDEVWRQVLQTGDYSLCGHSAGGIAIERKSLADLFGSFGQGRRRFEKEFIRLSGFRFPALMIEARMSDVFCNPPAFSKIHPKSVFRSVLAWQVRYGVHVFWAGNRAFAEKLTYLLLDRYGKENGGNHD